LQGNIIKYVTRHKNKNGAQDIKKAIHYLELILALQYGANESLKQAEKLRCDNWLLNNHAN